MNPTKYSLPLLWLDSYAKQEAPEIGLPLQGLLDQAVSIDMELNTAISSLLVVLWRGHVILFLATLDHLIAMCGGSHLSPELRRSSWEDCKFKGISSYKVS